MKAKNQMVQKKLKFEDYTNCLEASQLESKINYLEKNKANAKCHIENWKKIIKNNKMI